MQHSTMLFSSPRLFLVFLAIHLGGGAQWGALGFQVEAARFRKVAAAQEQRVRGGRLTRYREASKSPRSDGGAAEKALKKGTTPATPPLSAKLHAGGLNSPHAYLAAGALLTEPFVDMHTHANNPEAVPEAAEGGDGGGFLATAGMLALLILLCCVVCFCCSPVILAGAVVGMAIKMSKEIMKEMQEEKRKLEERMPDGIKEYVKSLQFTQKCEDIFDEHDKGKTGELDPHELRAAVLKAYGHDIEGNPFFMALFDKQGTGNINKDDFVEVMTFLEYLKYDREQKNRPAGGDSRPDTRVAGLKPDPRIEEIED